MLFTQHRAEEQSQQQLRAREGSGGGSRPRPCLARCGCGGCGGCRFTVHSVQSAECGVRRATHSHHQLLRARLCRIFFVAVSSSAAHGSPLHLHGLAGGLLPVVALAQQLHRLLRRRGDEPHLVVWQAGRQAYAQRRGGGGGGGGREESVSQPSLVTAVCSEVCLSRRARMQVVDL
jgi:hypothetical protein